MKPLLFLIFIPILSFGQIHKTAQNDWSVSEKQQYSKLNELANYIYKKKKGEISKDSLFESYIYFDYVLNDTLTERKEKRLAVFDTLFYAFIKTVDTVGLENLDAQPVRFYKDHKIYEPFDESKAKKSVGGKKMYRKDANVFAYYRKEEPHNPLGTLLFEPETNKLLAWIMINQGGYKYFLTFNLF